MQIYTVWWDHSFMPIWPPKPSVLEMCSEWKLQKSGLQTSKIVLFWKLPVSYSEAGGENWAGVHQPMFPESMSIGLRSYAPQVKDPGQANTPLSQKEWECFSLLFVQCPRHGSLPRTVTLIVRVSWDSGAQGPLASRARWGVSPGNHPLNPGHQV